MQRYKNIIKNPFEKNFVLIVPALHSLNVYLEIHLKVYEKNGKITCSDGTDASGW